MAIQPLAGHLPDPAVPDNPQSRYGSLLSEAEWTGEQAGQPIGDIGAESGSANEQASLLAGEVASLTTRVEALEQSPPSHKHPQSDVTDLAVALDDILARLDALENP